jgi:hypothetical protein
MSVFVPLGDIGESRDPHALWRVAVHRLQLTMGEGQGWRHIHLATHDFDIRSGFAGAG